MLAPAAWWPSASEPAAGIFIKEHVNAIAMDHEVVVCVVQVVKTDPGLPRITITDAIEDGSRVLRALIRTPLRRFGMEGRLVRRAYRRMIALCGPKGFDLMHVHVRDHITRHALSVARGLELPVVVSEHSSFYHKGMRSLSPPEREEQRKAISSWFNDPLVRLVMPVSRDLATILVAEFGLAADKVLVIPNMANAVFTPASKPTAPPFRILLAAKWQPPKDPDTFIEALLLLDKDLRTGLHVDWVGYGPQYAGIQERCMKELPDTDIRFPGAVDKATLADLMRKAHLFVHPTRAENLPCVIIESLSCGTPVLSMDVNGVPELVNAGNGILVPPNAPDRLAAALRHMLESVEGMEHMAIARQARERYGTEAMRQAFRSAYSRALGYRVTTDGTETTGA